MLSAAAEPSNTSPAPMSCADQPGEAKRQMCAVSDRMTCNVSNVSLCTASHAGADIHQPLRCYNTMLESLLLLKADRHV